MKRIFALLICSFCLLGITKAQYVTIPDAGFVSWLQSNYPACMNGNQMDTTCQDILNANDIAIQASISDLTGISYFVGLRHLWIEQAGLTYIPDLPAGLVFLDVSTNSLSALPTLPASLDTLKCYTNNLSALPALPSGLRLLQCDDNQITALPALPAGLTFLTCASNPIPSLPALDASLVILSCQYLKITSLPALPASLQYLHLSHNRVSTLPTLPAGLLDLQCDFNPLYQITVSLPAGLQIFDCQGDSLSTLPVLPTSTMLDLYLGANPITSLPANISNMPMLSTLAFDSTLVTSIPALPSTVTTLVCSHNPLLTALPALPLNLQHLDCSYDSSLLCLPQLNSIRNFNFNNTGITCLPNLPSGNVISNPALNSVPLCLPGNVNGCLVLGTVTANTGPNQTICPGSSVTIGGAPTATGGTGPYTYTWSPAAGLSNPGAPNPLASPVVTTIYHVTVTDANNAQAFDSVTVTIGLTVDSIVAHNFTCFNSGDGSLCIYVSGGTPPYNYMWSQGGSTPTCVYPNGGGNCTGTITDANNCSVSASATIIQPAPLSISITETDATCFGNSTGTLCYILVPGTGPFTYNWSNGQTTQCITNLIAGTYILTRTDANNCSLASAPAIVGQPAPLTVTITATTDTIHYGSIDTITAIASGGIPPYAYVWNEGSVTQNIYATWCGPYFASVTDANGCVILAMDTPICTFDDVWPGDANFDGVVDNNDLLPIGLGYDSTGAPRANTSLNWIGQPALDWNNTLSAQVNYKHIDCDGNGTINADDTTAILLNYSLTHARSGGMDPWRSGLPALTFTMSPDTIADGQIVTASLSLGDSTNIATNVYGLAFSFNYDNLVVDSTLVNINFNNSWLAGTGDHIDINKNFFGSSRLDAAITRIDHTTRSGYGNIATVVMKITAGNINGKDLSYYALRCFINKLTVIDNNGNVLQFNSGADSTQVAYTLPDSTVTGINPIQAAQTIIKLYPNPVTDQLNLTSANAEIKEIKAINAIGQPVLNNQQINAQATTINTTQLAAGTYILYIKTATAEYHKRFTKIKQ